MTDPRQIIEECADELRNFATERLRQSLTLIDFACRLKDPSRIGMTLGHLKRVYCDPDYPVSDEVANIANRISAAYEGVKPAKPKRKRRRSRQGRVATGNVVTVDFGRQP